MRSRPVGALVSSSTANRMPTYEELVDAVRRTGLSVIAIAFAGGRSAQ